MSIYRRSQSPNLDWQTRLDKSYHHLCRSVRPEAFYSWLRSKGVLTVSDQEEVQGKYMTTVMKTGHLIDIIKTKGEKGYNAFMEVVEYVYPDTYNILTGRQPRAPPPEFEPNAAISRSVVREKRSPALSAEILGQMGDLVNVLVEANAVKKEELAELQNYVKQLQEENQKMCEENRATLLKFKDAQEEIGHLNQKLSDLVSKHEHDIKERKELHSEQDRLSKLRDKYVEENQKLRKERDDLECKYQLKECEIQRSRTCRVPPSSQAELMKEKNNRLQLENKELRERLAELQGCRPTGNEPVNIEPTNGEQRIQELESMRDDLDMKAKEWQSKYTTLQERYDCVVASLEELKTERNQKCRQVEDLQRMYDKERDENQRLVADCGKYHDRFCIMESQMISLRQEIEHISLQSPTNRHLSSTNSANGNVEATSSHITRSMSESGMLKLSRPVEVIKQSDGKCPKIQRKPVINNKPVKTGSFSTA